MDNKFIETATVRTVHCARCDKSIATFYEDIELEAYSKVFEPICCKCAEEFQKQEMKEAVNEVQDSIFNAMFRLSRKDKK